MSTERWQAYWRSRSTRNSVALLIVAALTCGLSLVAVPTAERASADASTDAATVSARAAELQRNGDLSGALEQFSVASALYRAAGNSAGEAATLNTMGNVHDSLSQYGQALQFYQQALDIRRSTGDPAGEAATLNNIGNVHNNVGEYQKALEYYQQALETWLQISDSSGQAKALHNIGNVYNFLARYPLALDYYQQALDIVRANREPASEEIILRNIGTVRDTLGDGREALALYQQSLAIAQDVADASGQAATLSNIGDVYDTGHEYRQALDYYTLALAIARDIGDKAIETTTLENIGTVHESLHEYAAALDSYQQAIAVTEAIRIGARAEQFKTSWAARQAKLYERAINVWVRLGRASEAFELAERARARTFLDQLSQGNIDAFRGAPTELLQLEQKLRLVLVGLDQTLLAEHSRLAAQQDAVLIAELERRRATAQHDYQDVVTRLQVASPQYAAVHETEPLRVEDVQQKVPTNTTLVSYFLTGEHTLAFVVTRDSITMVELEATEPQLRTTLSEFREFASLTGDSPSLRQLHAWLIAPLQHRLVTSNLIVIPHGVLYYVPFAALTDGAHLLGSAYTISELPSASVLQFIQPRAESGAGSVAAFAYSNPAGLPALRFANQEAAAVAEMYGGQPVTGAAATPALLAQRAPSARLVHVAAHAELNPGSPLFSRIVLAPDADSSGSLDVQAVYGLDLTQTELVTLSACETQLGSQSSGDDVVGLTRAFLSAGTPSVVASLWQVDDAATTELMTAFYRELRAGRGKAEALQAAQATTRVRYPHPYFWAGFVLTGDRGPVQADQRPGLPLLIGAGLLVVVCLGVGWGMWRWRIRTRRDHVAVSRGVGVLIVVAAIAGVGAVWLISASGGPTRPPVASTGPTSPTAMAPATPPVLPTPTMSSPAGLARQPVPIASTLRRLRRAPLRPRASLTNPKAWPSTFDLSKTRVALVQRLHGLIHGGSQLSSRRRDKAGCSHFGTADSRARQLNGLREAAKALMAVWGFGEFRD